MLSDVIVVGAGAAGLMCAIEAGKRGRRVIVLEHNDRAGKKILISGGGRCNFTNLHCSARNFLSSNPHFCKSALARYTPADFIALLRHHGIGYHEKTLGQLFCNHSAREITEMLLEECRRAGVQVLTSQPVQSAGKPDLFEVQTPAGTWRAPALVIATGGLSIPKIGATDFGYRVARSFGIAVKECRPALVPFVFGSDDRREYCDLSGVSAEVIAGLGKTQFREKMLITHAGLSGPAILQISSYWSEGEPVRINCAPDRDPAKDLVQQKRAGDRSSIATLLSEYVPRRLAERLAGDNVPLQELSDRSLHQIAGRLSNWQVIPAATEGYGKAEVTAGGVDTAELSSQTMECKRVPGLYFIGEVVDVTGHLGGFNFQWAWASGYCAGLAV